MSKLIVEAITEYYGERCPDYDEGCFCCKVWKEYDALIAPARCDELNTVAYQYKFRDVWLVSDAPKVMRKDDYELRELVTRQNAEEVIAAERLKLEATAKVGLQLSEKIDALEADNKRLREALEPFADVADLDIGIDEDDRAVFWPISNERFSKAGRLRVGDLRRASKALGEAAASPLGEKAG